MSSRFAVKPSLPIRTLFALALTVIAAASAGSYWSTRHLAGQTEWVGHTHEVRAAIAGLLADLQEAEAGQLGFILTGDEGYLRRTLAAQEAVPGQVRALRRLTADNPAQQRAMQDLQPHIDRELADLRSAVERFRREGRNAAMAIIAEGAGKRELGAIRAALDPMVEEEERLLQQRSRAALVAAKTAAWTFILAALVASTFIVLLYAMLRRHFRLRETLLGREHRARSQAEAALAEQKRARTELVAKEAETRRLSKMNEAVVLNMGEGLYTVDEQGRVTFMNPAAERLLGWTYAELQGRKMHDAVHYTHADGAPFSVEECAGLRALVDGVALTNHEDVFVRKDGTCFPVIHSASRIVLGDEVRGLVVVFQDITNRKRLEAEHDALLATAQRAREAAENASRAKDSFLATISHELRTPLSPILTWTSLLQRESLDPAQVRKGLEAIRRCARAQAQLIEDLLDVSRIVSGKMRIEVRPVDLIEVIEAAVEVVRPAADAKQVRLQLVLDSKTPAVSGDPQRLQQVVWNLLSNAIKFTAKGGSATVTLERVNSHVEIAVSDTGQGMDREFLPHVFDRFQQADTSSTRFHMGLGLGLAIVRHIVEAHGGTVHAESPGPGRGSVFTVKLPPVLIQRSAGETVRRHPTKAAFPTDDFPALDGLRVLVVDDELDSNEVLRTLFGSCGADVRVADSVARALEVMDHWNPEVLISDVGMSGEDGYSLIAKVRAREDGSLPVIALTAFASTEDRVRLLSAGFTTHLPKPVEPLELLAVVARVATR